MIQESLLKDDQINRAQCYLFFVVVVVYIEDTLILTPKSADKSTDIKHI